MNAASTTAARAEDVCRHYLPQGRRQGRFWIIGDIDGNPGHSLLIRLSGSGIPGKWTDYVAPAIMLRAGAWRRSCARFAVSPQHNLSPA